MAHVSSSAIFSPSVARQQLAVAKDWNYVDRWLAQKFNGKPPPPFERTNDTLKALLALAALNEAADEDHDLISKVKVKALEEFQNHEAEQKETSAYTIELLENVEAHLTKEGQTALNALAATSTLLNTRPGDTEQLARKIIELQATSFSLDQTIQRVDILKRELQKQLKEVTAILEDLQSESYQPPPEVSKEISDNQRNTKALTAKISDLKDRVKSISASPGPAGPTIQDLQIEEENFRELLAVVKKLEAQVKSYHGLPHDTDLARLELEQLRVELREITEKRDGMFEGLVEKESPQKYRS